MIKRNLLSMVMVVAAAPAIGLSTKPVVAIAEPSTISLIAAGIVALGLTRRKIDKAAKS